MWQHCPVVRRPLAQSLQRCSGALARSLQPGWPGYRNPGIGTPVATLQIDFIHSASAISTWTVEKKFEIATLADFFCCCWIWTKQSLLPSFLLGLENLLKVQVA